MCKLHYYQRRFSHFMSRKVLAQPKRPKTKRMRKFYDGKEPLLGCEK